MDGAKFDIISLIVIASAAAMMILIERIYPYTPKQKIIRDGFWNDLVLYSGIQNIILGFIIMEFIRFIDNTAGLSRMHLISHWPLWLQTGFFVITHDFYIYWMHRWMHHNKYLWRIHEAHHSTIHVDWLSGSRSHSLEILINQTVEFMPIILLGAAPEVAFYKGIISAIWGMWIHSNIDIRNRPLQYIINGPQMHRWHHSDTAGDGKKNLTTKLAVWDWLFGTAYLPDNKKPAGYGITEVDFPKKYLKQHIYAFRSFSGDPTFMSEEDRSKYFEKKATSQ